MTTSSSCLLFALGRCWSLWQNILTQTLSTTSLEVFIAVDSIHIGVDIIEVGVGVDGQSLS